jgi:abequosyltransferase
VLTVAIPTFNRNHLLKACISRLLPQMHRGQRLLIVDNGSDVPVQETLGAWLKEQDAVDVQIVRNAVNVGGGANILRCLELCDTEWLYCLGDDDLVADDAIRNIEATIEAHPGALYLSFSRYFRRRRAVAVAHGLEQLVQLLEDWSSFLFMSSTVVNAAQLRPHARWGFLYAYSWAPLQAILLKCLEQGGTVVFSDRVLCVAESQSDEGWVPFRVAAGKMVLPELIADRALRARFATRLMEQPRPALLLYWARADGDGEVLEGSRFFIDLYLRRCAQYARPAAMLFYRLLAAWMLCPRLFPRWLFEAVESVTLRVTRRPRPPARSMSHDRG